MITHALDVHPIKRMDDQPVDGDFRQWPKLNLLSNCQEKIIFQPYLVLQILNITNTPTITIVRQDTYKCGMIVLMIRVNHRQHLILAS